MFRGRPLLLESETVQKSPEVQDLTSSRRFCIVLGPSAVESAVVPCIFDFHVIGDLLYSMAMLDVDLRDELLPPPGQSVSYPCNT